MSAVTTVVSGGKPRKGRERAGRSVLAGDGREARPAPAPELHTPPSNTGVNNGVSSDETLLAPPPSRSLPFVPFRLPRSRKTRHDTLGRFSASEPLNDIDVYRDVFARIRAFDTVLELLAGLGMPKDQHLQFVGSYLLMVRQLLAEHTYVVDRGIPKEKRARHDSL